MKRIIVIFFVIIFGTSIFGQTLDEELINACYDNNEKAVFDLLRQGANPNAKLDAQITPLMYSVQNGNLLLVEKLLKSGANPNIYSDYVSPAINNAIINNDTAIVYILLENGADPNIFDKKKRKPQLFYSIENNNYVITELLLYYGANSNITIDNETPLSQAISSHSDTNIIKLLLKYKAKPNKENNLGDTPLLLAILYNNISLGKILLNNGASATQKSSKINKDPLELSIKYHSKEFTDLLLPYYTSDLKKYHSYALSNNFSYAADKIRKQSDKKYLKPVFGNIIFSTASLFTFKDIFGGGKIGFSESRYNIDFQFGILTRFWPKAVLIEQSENNFLQLREKRTMLTAGIDKNFNLFSKQKYSFGFSATLNFYYSFGSYKGINMKINHEYVFSPGIDLWFRIENRKIAFRFAYLPINTDFPLYSGINLNMFFPLY